MDANPPKNRTRFKALDKLGRDPRVSKVWVKDGVLGEELMLELKPGYIYQGSTGIRVQGGGYYGGPVKNIDAIELLRLLQKVVTKAEWDHQEAERVRVERERAEVEAQFAAMGGLPKLSRPSMGMEQRMEQRQETVTAAEARALPGRRSYEWDMPAASSSGFNSLDSAMADIEDAIKIHSKRRSNPLAEQPYLVVRHGKEVHTWSLRQGQQLAWEQIFRQSGWSFDMPLEYAVVSAGTGGGAVEKVTHWTPLRARPRASMPPMQNPRGKPPKYPWFVVNSLGRIVSGWEFKEDAKDDVDSWAASGLKFRVLARRTVIAEGINPDTWASWEKDPSRDLALKYGLRNPAGACPTCGNAYNECECRKRNPAGDIQWERSTRPSSGGALIGTALDWRGKQFLFRVAAERGPYRVDMMTIGPWEAIDDGVPFATEGEGQVYAEAYLASVLAQHTFHPGRVSRRNPAGLTSKGERMYEHVKAGYGRSPRAKEIAARTVYARAGEGAPGLVKNPPVSFPTVAEVADVLKDLLKEVRKHQGLRGDGVEVRLQVTSKQWSVHHGDPGYDTDHHGWWGADFLAPDALPTDLKAMAKRMIEEAEEQFEQEID